MVSRNVSTRSTRTRSASFERRLRCLARNRFAIIAVAILLLTAVSLAITPADGGTVGGTTIVVDNSPGDQLDPHACMVFDVVTHNAVTIATGTSIGATALGGDTVAFIGSGDIWAGSISGGSLTNLGDSSKFEKTPAVSPSGSLVVWASCPAPLSPCDITKATLSGGVWSAQAVVASAATNPVDGVQLNPSTAGGVIVFASSIDGIEAADLFVYQISTNTLFRVTDTPGTNELLNDVTVLAGGDVRVVWAANDDGARLPRRDRFWA